MPRTTSPEKEIAFKLWDAGHSKKFVKLRIPQISDKTLNIWFKEYREKNPSYREKLDDCSNNLDAALLLVDHEKWLQDALALSAELQQGSRAVRIKILKHLLTELDKPTKELNHKLVGVLTSSLVAVQKSEFILAGLHNLDPNHAMQSLVNLGYEVIDPRAMN